MDQREEEFFAAVVEGAALEAFPENVVGPN
jgi:hypothetical protein